MSAPNPFEEDMDEVPLDQIKEVSEDCSRFLNYLLIILLNKMNFIKMLFIKMNLI